MFNLTNKKMKYKFYINLLFFSLISNFAYSQVLDEAFLKSLPDDIAFDLIKSNQNRETQEAAQYRRPSTFIEKPEPTSNRFGATIFSMMQSTLMPLNEPNFDGSYTLDFGDELELQLVGQKSIIQKMRIKRDGSVNIEDIGKLFITGLSLNEAVELIKNKIKQSFIGVDAFVTLTNVRDIQIIMAGNVYNPGPYTLNGNSNIFHALSVSGGPSEKGSFRSIDLIRDKKIIETIDLYDTFIFGRSSFGTRLRSGDLIFINSVQNIISLSGGFKRPGSYELKLGEPLSTALSFGNGFSAYADINNIKLERIVEGKIKGLRIVKVSEFDDIVSKDADKIFIRAYPFRAITISGAVLNPGTYLMNEGDNVNDAIGKAGGLSSSSYPFGAVYENENAREINRLAIKKLYENSIMSISDIMKQSVSEINFSPLISILTELKDAEASGRVVIDLEADSGISLLVKDGDTLLIPETANQVYLYGAISSNGTALYKDEENLPYYLQKKGGLTVKADKNAIFVLQPNGETVNIEINRNIFKNQTANVKIYPGSIIFIPEKIDTGYSSVLRSQAYATILGNLGVSLASLSVLKD